MGYDKIVDSARLDGALTATAEAIRSKTDSTEPIPFDMDKGFSEAVDSISIGGDTEEAYKNGVRAMWDVVQQNGECTDYSYRFYNPDYNNPIWNDETLMPPYDIVPLKANRMFRGLGVTDMPKLLKELGDRKIDFSNCLEVEYLFSNAKALKKYGIFNVNKDCENLLGTFAECDNLETIEEIVIPKNCYTKWEKTFIRDYSLKNIRFGGYGYITNNIDFANCPLSKESFVNTFEHFSTTASFTATFNKTAKEAAFTADEWTALVGTRRNVTIALK